MNIETMEWATASEAARILNVTPQRVTAMADEDGSLDVIRPWPHVTLIGRRSLAEWVAGKRQDRIQPAQARRYLLQQTGVKRVQELDINIGRDQLRDFIEVARPRWDDGRKDLWALQMASRLWRAGGTEAA